MRLIAVGLAGLLALFATGCINLDLGAFQTRPLEERVIFGEEGPKILLMDLAGTISETGDSGAFGVGDRESTVSRVRQQLEIASEDDEVKALLLRINSPGGTANASEIVYQEIMRFRSERKIPVVAQLMGIAASGGYYVAMAADTVRAYPTSVTGSIGVIFAGVNLSALMEKVGIENQTLTTGSFKDAGSPLRPMSEEERAQLGSVLDDLYERFLHVVEEGRPDLTRDRLEVLADGRIYSAPQALENGLIDAIGDLPGAVDEAKSRAGLSEARVVVYQRPGELRENLFSPKSLAGIDPRMRLLEALAGPSFLYLWGPVAH